MIDLRKIWRIQVNGFRIIAFLVYKKHRIAMFQE